VIALAAAPAAQATLATTAAIAPTPPMGWSSWYRFTCHIDQGLFEHIARTMASDGMRAAGYKYVDVDDCWETRQRAADGSLVPNPARFPSGIAGLAQYVHGLGLKLGLYLDAGTKTCTGFPGSEGHFTQDASTVASWSVDAIKMDYCEARPAHAEPIYQSFANALADTGRQIMLNICEWGYEQPWTWAAGIGETWRTTGDYFTYGAPRTWWGSIMTILNYNAPLAAFAHPGAFNDPNMMLIGTGYLTVPEERAQMSLWSVMAAPLVAGGELARTSPATIGILTNKGVIAVDQDPGGSQGTRVVNVPDHQVWVRKLRDGSEVVLFLNTSATGDRERVQPAAVGLAGHGPLTAQDLWLNRTAKFPGALDVYVGAHDVRMLEFPAGEVPQAAPAISEPITVS
jgi:alpha-galactosidase